MKEPVRLWTFKTLRVGVLAKRLTSFPPESLLAAILTWNGSFLGSLFILGGDGHFSRKWLRCRRARDSGDAWARPFATLAWTGSLAVGSCAPRPSGGPPGVGRIRRRGGSHLRGHCPHGGDRRLTNGGGADAASGEPGAQATAALPFSSTLPLLLSAPVLLPASALRA